MNIGKYFQPVVYFALADLRHYYYLRLLGNLRLRRPALEALRGHKLAKLMIIAARSSPFYKNYFQSQGLVPLDIREPADLKRLPIMDKKTLKDNLQDIACRPLTRLKRVASGGSTGELGVVYKSKYFQQISRAAFLRNATLAGWHYYDKSLWLWGAPYEQQKAARSLVSRLGVMINGRLLINAYHYDRNAFPFWLEKIRQYKPEILYGYASIIKEFAEWCLAHDISLPTFRSVVSTSEKLSGRQTIEEAFRCKVYDQYGCREVESIAMECPAGNLHVSDDTVIVEENDGCLLITALDSFDFPIIRYKLGDTGRLKTELCRCGLPLSLMELDIGRVIENFLLPGGGSISGAALSVCLAGAGADFSAYQLIQKKPNEFEMVFVPSPRTGPRDKEIVRRALEKYFGQIKMIFTEKREIVPEPSGKKLLFKCRVGQAED